MKKMMLAAAMVMLPMNCCFAMKYHTEIQESDYNNLMIRDEESLVQRRTDQFDYYPNFKALVEAIYNKDTQTALELIFVMTQEELNVRNYIRQTSLIIAIEQGQETIALALVNAMNQEGLLLSDMECVTALSYAHHYGMSSVVQAIKNKINTIN